MNFELSPELAELQQSVRRLAQDKVKPRAREIDESNEYPQDLFEIFRDAGLLGLVIPAEYGGSGAGILGLTIAIEEVAKYSNTAALMLLLTRLPTGPLLIAFLLRDQFGAEPFGESFVGALLEERFLGDSVGVAAERKRRRNVRIFRVSLHGVRRRRGMARGRAIRSRTEMR